MSFLVFFKLKRIKLIQLALRD